MSDNPKKISGPELMLDKLKMPTIKKGDKIDMHLGDGTVISGAYEVVSVEPDGTSFTLFKLRKVDKG